MENKRLTWKRDLGGYTDVGLREGVTVGDAICKLADLEERENPERLTIEQMKKMNCPVWVSFEPVMKGGSNGYWCLCNQGKIMTPQRNVFDVERIPDWQFYRYERKEN